jgi:hypothetical protein
MEDNHFLVQSSLCSDFNDAQTRGVQDKHVIGYLLAKEYKRNKFFPSHCELKPDTLWCSERKEFLPRPTPHNERLFIGFALNANGYG